MNTVASETEPVVSIVIPTFNRLKTLKQVIHSYLEQEGVKEVIFVDDAGSDGTENYLRQLQDEQPKVVYIRQDRNRGLPTARNTGAEAATGDYVLFGEDDLRLCPEYALRLVRCLEKQGGSIAAGRILFPFPGESDKDALRRVNTKVDNRLDRRRLAFNASAPADNAIRVPFIHAISLVRRDVFDTVRYDPGYRGNAYREETDFYLRAGQSGHKIFFCPDALCVHLPREVQQLGGSMSRGIWVYKYWSLRNNYRFLRRHYRYLRQNKIVEDSFLTLMASFALAEFKKVPSFYLRKFSPATYSWLASRLNK